MLFIKFPSVYLQKNNMEKEIVAQATSLFLQYGFKSVTMDDITEKMGVSKKTIYVHFPKKEQLVLESVMQHIDLIIDRIINISKYSKDPIIQLYQLKKEAMKHLSNLLARKLVGSITIRDSLCAHQAKVSTTMRLGQVHRACPLACHHLRQILLLLLIRTMHIDR